MPRAARKIFEANALRRGCPVEAFVIHFLASSSEYQLNQRKSQIFHRKVLLQANNRAQNVLLPVTWDGSLLTQ
jgi:hypothetical protein